MALLDYLIKKSVVETREPVYWYLRGQFQETTGPVSQGMLNWTL